ncbi:MULTISPECIES: LacI family DNA-binding transcriptional regulator [unclassified Janthinobacterium]|uniref:LacI family DNA-binding transcriptional regulator n=1 Tax=unclassified Janthinobacterium TaxID=2610881 RepID=UPI001612E485|nr:MULTISPECIES: LacI family DNA-binding transcriptional regulator [unclassified Janthinobacterium]MBB5371538.1 LacI family transcriptional regulator [Janthinobacterium sp. K2C7]MBB5384394.1 LacI family transcriptional regulator [Janthinobacterium sp. K2Li3]MBB5389670.1 LacI family transcriptional regulator [Janthinobacterium sp. K2E3]
MATIKQVAQAAGVSFTTVSHVLNNTRPVSDEARAAVLAAAEQLHYVPSALARSLRSRSTGTIGLIITNNTNPYFSEVARGIEDSCYAAGYSVILCNSDDDPVKQREYLNVLLTKRCDGLILSALADSDGALLRKMKVPAVLLDRAPNDLSIDAVAVDNHAGGVLAARHLLALGRRRIACIAGPREVTISNERIAGARAAMQDAGVPLPDALCRHADFTSAGGYAAALDLLALPAGQRPDAVFCCNDLMAIGVLRAAAERGISVPGQLAVVGFDDIDLASFVYPALTSVAQNTRELGRVTADFLLARIAEPGLPRQQRSMAPMLQVRGSSVATAAAADSLNETTELTGQTP